MNHDPATLSMPHTSPVSPQRPRPVTAPGAPALLCGWGRTTPTRAWMLRPRTPEEVAEALGGSAAMRVDRRARHFSGGGAIARGAGRSYGDAAQNGGGVVIDATALRGELALDREHRVLRVGAGRTFAEILLYLAARGLTLPVVPGTRHVTVGGAIASDVHGKNHLRDGSLARHVESLTLCTPADGPRPVSAACDRDLFDATLGGMGLTGVVLEASLRVAPMRSTRAVADVERLDTLDRAIALISGEQSHRYAIAWVDLLAEGPAFGRSVLTRSEEASSSSSSSSFAGARGEAPFAMRPRLTVPRGFPGGLLSPAAVRAFNAVHWRSAPRRERGRSLSMSAQLFPLDVLGEWSRLYGPGGLLQYQFAVPRGREETLLRVVHRLRERRQPMYLAVLKRFGPGTGGPLSFPIEGLTLAIDLPAGAPGLYDALEEADELLVAARGRVYLAKDARLRPQMLTAMYPELERFGELRGRIDPDGVLRSDMGRRLGLCG